MTRHPTLRPTLHRLTHRLTRRIARHHATAAIAAVSIVCAGTPIAVLTLVPPTVAQPAEPRPVSVPEPGALWVLGTGLVGLVAVKGRNR